jgi:two-component system, LuxR family, sensor kinase FixL
MSAERERHISRLAKAVLQTNVSREAPVPIGVQPSPLSGANGSALSNGVFPHNSSSLSADAVNGNGSGVESRATSYQSNALLRLFIETAPDAVVIAGARGVILSFSPAAERLFGYTASEVIGKNLSVLMPPQHSVRHDSYMSTYFATGQRRIIGTGRPVVAKKKTGEIFPVELAVGEMVIDGERVFTGFMRDVTARRCYEKRISELQNELIHVSRFSAMGELATALAHELNQPLTAICNYLQAARGMFIAQAKVLGGEEACSKALELMAKGADQAQRAGQVIRKLRQFVKHREVEREWSDICSAVEEAMQIASLDAMRKTIDIEGHFPKNPIYVHMDRIQIQQVVANLVRNAVDALTEWPRDRKISVDIVQVSADEVEVAVADTGAGVQPQVLARLFQPFTTTKQEGVGIGLALSRRIVEAHGGTIVGENRPEGGATFRFVLPIGKREEDGFDHI